MSLSWQQLVASIPVVHLADTSFGKLAQGSACIPFIYNYLLVLNEDLNCHIKMYCMYSNMIEQYCQYFMVNCHEMFLQWLQIEGK